MKDLMTEFSKIPAEDLIELYGDTVVQFAQIREKLHSTDEKERDMAMKAREELKAQLQVKMAKLYKNVGVDFNQLISTFQKNLRNPEGNIII